MSRHCDKDFAKRIIQSVQHLPSTKSRFNLVIWRTWKLTDSEL
jgi:hypothetical protein